MKSWPQITLRTFGVLHMLVALLGVMEVGWTFLVFAPRWLGPDPAYPYALKFWYVDAAMDLLCLIFLVRAGVALWRLESRGRWLSNAVLGFEIFWFLADGAIGSLLLMWGGRAERVGASMVRGGGAVTGVQILTGYPLIALIAINLAYRRLHHAPSLIAPLHGKRETQGKPWARTVLRGFGVADIAVGLWGLYVAALSYVVVVTERMGMDATHPYVLPIYRTETAVGVLCLLLLIPTGVALWRLKRRGLQMSRALLGFAFVYFLIEQAVRLVLLTRGGKAEALGSSFESSIGSALLIFPIVLYQLVAVFAISKAFRGMREAEAGAVPRG